MILYTVSMESSTDLDNLIDGLLNSLKTAEAKERKLKADTCAEVAEQYRSRRRAVFMKSVAKAEPKEAKEAKRPAARSKK